MLKRFAARLALWFFKRKSAQNEMARLREQEQLKWRIQRWSELTAAGEPLTFNSTSEVWDWLEHNLPPEVLRGLSSESSIKESTFLIWKRVGFESTLCEYNWNRVGHTKEMERFANWWHAQEVGDKHLELMRQPITNEFPRMVANG